MEPHQRFEAAARYLYLAMFHLITSDDGPVSMLEGLQWDHASYAAEPWNWLDAQDQLALYNAYNDDNDDENGVYVSDLDKQVFGHGGPCRCETGDVEGVCVEFDPTGGYACDVCHGS